MSPLICFGKRAYFLFFLFLCKNYFPISYFPQGGNRILIFTVYEPL